MTISFGFNSNKEKSSSFSTTNTQPTNPLWVSDLATLLGGKISEGLSMDPYKLTPGSNPLLDKAFSNALGTNNGGKSVYDEAIDIARRGATAGASSAGASSLLEGLDKYISPYLQQVVNTTLANFDFEAGKTRAEQDLALAGGAFSGSGAALTKSMTEENLARTRASTVAGLYDDAFRTGANLSNLDAQRRTDVSIANAQLAEQANMRSIAGATAMGDLFRDQNGTLASLGDYMRGMEREHLRSPLELTSWGVQNFSALPLDLFRGQVVQSAGSSKGSSFGFNGGVSIPII